MRHRPVNPLDSADRRGVALMLVLITLSVVFVMGLAMMEGLAGSMRSSSNLADHTAAVYLAESGLAEGLYRLKHPSGESIWPGVTGRALDDSGNTYDVTVSELGDNRYRITSTSHVTGRRGQSLSHTLQMEVVVETAGTGFAMTHSLCAGSSGFVPSHARITGDMHVNGVALVFGQVSGTVSATHSVRTLGHGSVGGVEQYADEVELPDIDLDAYENYTFNGSTGSARVYDSKTLARQDSVLEPADSANPLGVVVVDGNLVLSKDLTLHQGILVVRGNVILNGHSLTVEGPQGHFSFLAQGHIIFSHDSQLSIRSGSAYVGGLLLNGFHSTLSKASFDDGLVMRHSLPLIFLGQLEIDNKAYRDQGQALVQYFGGAGGGGTGLRVVRPVSYAVVTQ